MASSASASDTDRFASERGGDDDGSTERAASAPFARSQRDLVIASLLRCPESPTGDRRNSTR